MILSLACIAHTLSNHQKSPPSSFRISSPKCPNSNWESSDHAQARLRLTSELHDELHNEVHNEPHNSFGRQASFVVFLNLLGVFDIDLFWLDVSGAENPTVILCGARYLFRAIQTPDRKERNHKAHPSCWSSGAVDQVFPYLVMNVLGYTMGQGR